MRDRIRARRCLLLAASGLISSAMATQALAALPITLGPGSANATVGSLYSPFVPTPAESVSNRGVALAEYALGTSSGGQARTLFITPGASYTLLGTISGGDGVTNEDAISADGYVTGRVDVSSDGTVNGALLGTRPVRYNPGSATAVPLGLASNSLDPVGNGIVSGNLAAAGGAVAGSTSTYVGSTYTGRRGVVWKAGSTVATLRQPLTTQANNHNFGTASTAVMNDSGVAGGFDEHYDASSHDLGTRPTRWGPDSTTGAELAVPTTDASGFTNGNITAINSSGTAWGYVAQYDTSGALLGNRPARWDAGTTAITPLGIVGTDINGKSPDAAVNDANDAGTAVGYVSAYTSGFASLGRRAVRWNAGSTTATLLGTLFTGTASGSAQVVTKATAVNALGTTAGSSLTASGTASRAVLWLPGSTTPLDLTTLVTPNTASIQSLDEADGVSDTGWVSGIATYAPNASPKFQRAFTMLVPQAGTYGKGDANFDTHVNFDDLIVLAQNYNKANAAQATNVGDFNLDGQTNFDDLIVLAQNYNTTPGAALASLDASFAADWALAQSLVPEPMSWTLAGGSLAIWTRRRRVSRDG